MELLKCSGKSDWTSSAQLTIYWPWSQFCWSLSALPLPHYAGSWCSKHPFPGSFANGFLQRFTQGEALGGDGRADGKDWCTSHLFPHSMSTLPRKSPCIVMAPHPCKWLNVLHDSSSNLKALVLMPIRVIPWWPSYFLTPSCQNQLLGAWGPWFLFTPLILWQLHLWNIWGHPLPLCSLLSLPTLLQLMMP